MVLDTNVYISHFYKPGGIPTQILIAASKKVFQVVITPALLDELREVLTLKFGFSADKSDESIKTVLGLAEIVHPFHHVSVVAQDPDDNRILECALSGTADYIITGDKRHLIPLKSFRGIPIMSPAEFARIFHTAS